MVVPQAPTKEYQLKAGFLYQFTRFIDWPAAAFEEPNSAFVIAILGSDPFGTYLDDITRNESKNGHPIVVKRFHNIQEVTGCHILFISDYPLTDFDALKYQPVLTIVESKKLLRAGAIINFVNESNKIRLQIAAATAKKVNLNISSKLLRLADIIN